MKNDRLVIVIIILVLLVACAGVFLWVSRSAEPEPDMIASDGGEDVVETDDSFENGISFDEEEDGAQIEKVNAPDEDFIGSWTATSDMSSYLYGNIDINIKNGGVWTGNITDEDMSGTWRREGPDLHITSTDGDIDLIFAFTKDGTLVMQRNLAEDGEEDEFVNTVLTKK